MSSKDRYEKTFSRKNKKETTTTMKTSIDKPKSHSKNQPPINNTPPKPTKITFKLKQPTNNQPSSSLPTSTKKVKPEKDEVLGSFKKRKVEDDNVETIMDMKIKKKKMKEKVKDEKDEILIKEMKFGKKSKEIEEEEEEDGLECVFPTARITRIVKSEGSDCKITAEAVFLINKATEKFIELFSEEAYEFAVEDKKNFVGYKHLSSAVSKGKALDFLSDFVPEKVTAEKALAERNPPPATLPS